MRTTTTAAALALAALCLAAPARAERAWVCETGDMSRSGELSYDRKARTLSFDRVYTEGATSQLTDLPRALFVRSVRDTVFFDTVVIHFGEYETSRLTGWEYRATRHRFDERSGRLYWQERDDKGKPTEIIYRCHPMAAR